MKTLLIFATASSVAPEIWVVITKTAAVASVLMVAAIAVTATAIVATVTAEVAIATVEAGTATATVEIAPFCKVILKSNLLFRCFSAVFGDLSLKLLVYQNEQFRYL